MEVDPTETMQRELNRWAELAKEIAVPGESDSDGDDNDMVKKIKQFQEWLSGIPGIDEATALSSAIEHIESNKYDLIVFDTAPTGHTLKLLGMPDILQAGIEKLQGWQSTLWGYWDVLKGLGSSVSKNRLHAKEEVAQMLENYKTGIQKVALMLQDQRRTRFVVVCIAEYLSISETQRLLRELKRNNVRASHIIVNQLVIENALSSDELADLEGLAEVGSLILNQELLSKTVHACRLTTARKGIQEKYLSQLKSFPETEEILDGICEVPLLAEEVTGNDALSRFAKYMIRDPPSVEESSSRATMNSGQCRLYDNQLIKKKEKTAEDVSSWTPTIGDGIKINALAKAAQYNGMQGVIVSTLDSETDRCGVKIEYNGKSKILSLQMKNMVLLHKTKKARSGGDIDPSVENGSGSAANAVSKAMSVLDDPEIKALVESNPKFKDAVEECIKNPISFMKYISDPEMSPLISKAMSKLKF